MKKRTYGWIQNPSDFSKLKLVVQIFDCESEHYKNLKEQLIQDYIPFEEIKRPLLKKMEFDNVVWSYSELVGTSKNIKGKSPKKRGDAVADSLIQITVLPQNHLTKGKKWTDNWTSDGFLRWAVSFGFVIADSLRDVFEITSKGKIFSRTEVDSEEEKEVFREALLSYPPATRILEILNDCPGSSKNKFYLGNRLGFKGEKGFTSYDETLMRDWLKIATPEERKSIKSDIEGTSDKYARMISNWLVKVGFLVQRSCTEIANGHSISGFPEYSITAQGIHAFRQSLGSSKNNRKSKFIMWEFLATDGENRNYIRSRRAVIIRSLEQTKSFKTLLSEIRKLGFNADEETIKNDIHGLQSVGIRIKYDGEQKIELLDKIEPFTVPIIPETEELKNVMSEKRKAYFLKNTNLDSKYLELLEIAYDGNRNRDFEILTADLFKNVYGLNTHFMRGGRRPDIIAYSGEFGLIIDTKAYSNGYSKNISEEDKMVRYMEDNIERSIERNSTEWWNNFFEDIAQENFYFLWVSSKFIGEFQTQLESTSSRIKRKGGALNVEQLLLTADAIQKEELRITDFFAFFDNKEIKHMPPPDYND